jgi:hypothetical protein
MNNLKCEKCGKKTGHKSGLCIPCRSVKCVSCGKPQLGWKFTIKQGESCKDCKKSVSLMVKKEGSVLQCNG